MILESKEMQVMNNIGRKANADRILYEFGLWEKIEEIGKAHIVGSYRMDMMAWNDLDIDIENDAMSLDKMYELSSFIMNNSFEKYKSMDVYKAVLENNVKNIDEFIMLFESGNSIV